MQIYRHRHTITNYNGQDFNVAHGFASIEDTDNTTYYVFDFYNQIVVMFNEYWEYRNNVSITHFAHAITIDKELYILGDGKIHKRDKNLNLIKEFINNGVSYRGIYYNKTNDLIYVGTEASQTIDIFNRDLTLVGNIITPGYAPYAIAEHDNKMYVGTTVGSILIIENGVIIQNFTTVCSDVSSIMIDSYGFMLVLSVTESKVYVYYINGTKMETEIATYTVPRFINFDSKVRLIITSDSDIKIYY